MSTAYGPMMIQDAPDGPGVLTPDDDGKFMMWDGSRRQMIMAAIRMTGQANTILRSGGYRIQDSSDGPGVLTVADDGKALVWDNGTGRFVMTAFEASGAVAAHVLEADPHTGYLLVNGTRASTGAQTFTNGIIANTGADSGTPIVAKAFSATQTANLQEWRNSSDAVLAAISANGALLSTVPSVALSGNSYAAFTDMNAAPPSASTGSFRGYFARAIITTAVNLTSSGGGLIGIRGNAQADGGGTVTTAWGIVGYVQSSNSSIVTNAVSVYAFAPTTATSGTIVNAYGLYIPAISSGGTSNHSIYTNAGDVRLMAGNSDKIGFHGVTPVARQLLATGAGATVDSVITALQNLGLLRQS